MHVTLMASRLIRASLAGVLLLGASPALADVTKGQCVDANATGQSLRIDGKLAEARRELQLCTSSSCPPIVRTDCAQRMDELDRAQPTIVFDVKDASGSDVLSVQVTMDGKPLTDSVAGAALRVDPGAHAFTFTAPGHAAVTRSFVIKEGVKGRNERVVIDGEPTTQPTSPLPTPILPPERPSPSPGMGTQKIVGLAAGGVGAFALVLGGVFGALTFAAVSDQTSDCTSPTSCTSHKQAVTDHSAAVTDGGVSTAALIVGGVLVATGVTLFFTAPRASSEHAPVAIVPSVGPGGAGMFLRGEF
jgi:hypothetical protein